VQTQLRQRDASIDQELLHLNDHVRIGQRAAHLRSDLQQYNGPISTAPFTPSSFAIFSDIVRLLGLPLARPLACQCSIAHLSATLISCHPLRQYRTLPNTHKDVQSCRAPKNSLALFAFLIRQPVLSTALSANPIEDVFIELNCT
jgi:hypothetical protein